jgi:hypothetical protein
LLSLALANGELSDLPECGVRCHIDLSSENWEESEHYEQLYESRDFFYIKHQGLFKPWAKWVLHPAKSIYLHEWRKLGKLIGTEALSTLRDGELCPSNIRFLVRELFRFDVFHETHHSARTLTVLPPLG